MSDKPQKSRSYLRGATPPDPAITPFDDWLPANQSFYGCFRRWLLHSGYSPSALLIYGVAVRQVIGFLNKPYWLIDPNADLDRAWEYLKNRPIQPSTQSDYHKGVLKLDEYLRLHCRMPKPEKTPDWDFYLGAFPEWLAAAVRQYITHCRRAWKAERRYENTCGRLSHLTLSLRWMVAQGRLAKISDLTPALWLDYIDTQLADGRSPGTLNSQLSVVQAFLHFLQDLEQPICERMLLVVRLDAGRPLPRDLPVEQLRRLQAEILTAARSTHKGVRRTGLLDHAWFLLMLHSGLRTVEVRCLRPGDIDWQGRRIRIEQSKGLKDRIVYLSQATIQALQAYLEVRGPAEALPEQVFIYRHRALTASYCRERLQTYGERCGVLARPHELRHSCATLLLNAGAPVLTVQNILGHKWVDTTLGYARLYDGTVAADYYQAMAVIERQMALPEDKLAPPPSVGQLLALVDSLRYGTLNPHQVETVRQLRAGLMALAERENAIQDVKVLTLSD